MSDTPPPGSIRISCLLLDDRNLHLSSAETKLNVDLPAAEIREMKVSKFLLKAQDAHPVCDFCFGSLPVLVKSAYVLHYSINFARPLFLTKTILTLQDTVPGKLKFMTSDLPLSQFIGDDGINAPKLTIILECTFDVKRVPKRDRSPDGEEDANNKRPKITLSQLGEHYPELLLLPDNENAVTPINLLPRSFSFSSYPSHVGVFLVDKSRFISPAVKALMTHRFCTLALPPGSGKTVFVSMLQAWLDHNTDATHLFSELAIFKRQEIHQLSNAERPRACLLIFDLKNALWDRSSKSTASQSIETYLCETIKTFVVKHQKEIGNVSFAPRDSAETMIAKILKCKPRTAWTLSIFLDHWDHQILTSLPAFETVKNSAAACIQSLAAFVQAIARPTGRQSMPVTLLVIGNLPFINGTSGNTVQMKNIALLPELNGAFGVTVKELTSIYTVFRTIRPGVQLSAAAAPATLGFFLPQSRTTSHKCLGFYSFSLVLHYLANQVGLNPEHKVLDSPPLKAVSQCCSKLLQYSSLRRRGHQVAIAPFHDELSFDSLLKFAKKEEALWKLLSFLGALKVCVPTRTLAARPDPMWTVEVCGDFARTQLFGTYSRLATTNETRHQKTLRSLLERDPHPLTVDLSSFLSRIPSFGLQRMSEAAFQAILDTYMDTYLEDINSPPIASSQPQETTTEYHNHYFSQLGLNTACGPALRQTHVGDLKIPGQGESGYLDAFVCGVTHLHPGRAVAMELKYINLWALIQGDDDNVPVKGAQFRTLCMQKIKQLETLSLEDLLKQRYVFRDYTTSQLQQRTSTVGECLQVARLQLESYLTALVKGRMLSYESVRINCSMDRDKPDELIGYVILGIGRRVISVEVEVPGLEASSHRFEGCPGWEEKYER